jgi:hypothetical protein
VRPRANGLVWWRDRPDLFTPVADRNVIAMVGARHTEEARRVFNGYEYPHKVIETHHNFYVPSEEPYLTLMGAPTEEMILGECERAGIPYKRYERAEDVPGPLGFD